MKYVIRLCNMPLYIQRYSYPHRPCSVRLTDEVLDATLYDTAELAFVNKYAGIPLHATVVMELDTSGLHMTIVPERPRPKKKSNWFGLRWWA